MEEQKQPQQAQEQKPQQQQVKHEEKKVEQKQEQKSVKVEKEKPKKTEAVVRARDLEISTKHAMAICDLIRYKEPNYCIEILEQVLDFKKAIPVRGEIPHRKKGHRIGKLVSGRYHQKASVAFIKLLKNLIANAGINGMNAENLKIETARADRASRPIKPTRIGYGRKKFKRTHVLIVAKERKGKFPAKENKPIKEIKNAKEIKTKQIQEIKKPIVREIKPSK